MVEDAEDSEDDLRRFSVVQSKRDVLVRVVACLVLSAAVGVARGADAGFTFLHPGLLHGRGDLARMKEAVAGKEEPVWAGYQKFSVHPLSQAGYVMKGPLPAVGRNGGAGRSGDYDNDAVAAHHLAVMWAITGEKAYAEKSRAIVGAWSRTLKTIDGRDAVLMAGLGPFLMVNAAEILRYTESGWTEEDSRAAEKCFREAVYPVVKDYALFANGNWDTAAMKTVMAIGIFCNDRAMFENAVRYYVDGAGDGALTHYIINDTGECQESGRDAAHSQLGLAHLGDCCEMAWNQGLDLYGYADNRLLKGFEYTAKYNLGEEVPFEAMIDRTGKYPWAKIAPRGALRPVYEEVYGHYAGRMGMTSEILRRAVEKVRPEGAAASVADHPGFGTLLFARTKAGEGAMLGVPAAPGGLIAKGSASGVELKWVASNGAARYTVKRRDARGGNFAVIARGQQATAYTDATVKAGEVYAYAITAVNAKGESGESMETPICAGLPNLWKEEDVGAVKVAGWSRFDGRMFTVSGAGKEIGGKGEGFHFVYRPMKGAGEMVVRFVPQMSGMRSTFGIMMREGVGADAAYVSLLVKASAGNAESPGYSAVVVRRDKRGGETEVMESHPIQGPVVADGRLMQPYWLKLERIGKAFFSASVSADGKSWERLAIVQMVLGDELLVGIPVCSGIVQNVGGKEVAMDTVIRMDNVAVTGWAPPVMLKE